MKSFLASLFIVSALSVNVLSQVNIIFDTDFGGDADDLGALAMIHAYIDEGKVNLLGVMSWSTEQYAVSGIDAVNTFYGRSDIPIGMRNSGVYHEPWNHSKAITDVHPFGQTPESVQDATSLYRKILSEAENESVVIVTVGPLANILYLLDSEGDKYSDLTGSVLVQQKVKEFVIMGGQYPEGEWEWNFSGNMPGVTKEVIGQLKTPITFLGYEVGLVIKTGEVFNSINSQHPLYLGYMHFSENAPWVKDNFKGEILDNASYDQTAILYAAEGGVGTYWERIENGVCIPDEEGGNIWVHKEGSAHSYLRLLAEPEVIAEMIETKMLNQK
ncbi:MAG: nucleoside hydrolase [Balneolales bacterium]|nr:nucleoside hydrolase [Balneolales bacterium]